MRQKIDHKRVGSFNSLDRILKEWAFGLTFLFERTQRSNHSQIIAQRLRLLLIYFKTFSLVRLGIESEPQA